MGLRRGVRTSTNLTMFRALEKAKPRRRAGIRLEKGRTRYLAWRMGQPISHPIPATRRELVDGQWFTVREVLAFCDGAVRPRRFGWAGIGFALYNHKGQLIEAQARESTAATRIGINRTEICAGAFALRRVRELLGLEPDE